MLILLAQLQVFLRIFSFSHLPEQFNFNILFSGLWFTTLSFCVHSVMYLYYFMAIFTVTLRKYARPFAPLITALQLLQIVLGAVVIGVSLYFHHSDPSSCAISSLNCKLGLGMYLPYFLLFAKLYYDSYLSTEGKLKRAMRDAAMNKQK